MTDNNIAMIDNQMYKNFYTLNTENSQDPQNSSDFKLNNVKQNEMIIQYDKCEVILKSFGYIFFSIILIISLIIFIVINISFILTLCTVLILLILIFLFLIFKIKHIKLIKNESLNLLILKKINYLNCENSTFFFNLQNIIIDVIKYKILIDETLYDKEALVITKIFNDNSEIDLNTSNIQNLPLKNLYHVFTDLKENTYTTESLRKFLGINLEIENPIIFNIYKYMGRSCNNPTFSDYKLSRYMKFSNHFFTYFFKVPCCYFSSKIRIIIAVFFFSYFILPFFMYYLKIFDILVTVICLVVTVLIYTIFLIFNVNAIIKHSLRIDIIYSSDFDTIFIALLNHNGHFYKKKFIHDINSIERFILENYKNYNNKSILKVAYRDKKVEDILIINESENDLDGLLFILNEKINVNQFM